MTEDTAALAPHVITAMVNGQAREWTYTDIDEATRIFGAMCASRVTPDSNEPVSDIVLLIAGYQRVEYPNGGWEGPRHGGNINPER